LTIENIKGTALFKKMFKKNKIEGINVSKIYRQQLTHQTIEGRFIQIKTNKALSATPYKAVTFNKLAKLPFPKLITGYLSENDVMAFER